MTQITLNNITEQNHTSNTIVQPSTFSYQKEDITSWQHHLSGAFKSIDDLCHYLALDVSKLPFSSSANKEFSLRVPLPYATRIEKGNYQDPLLLQILPSHMEMEAQPGYIQDPLEEAAANSIKGMIHKYKNRVLLTLSGACAINCRYCFRRHFPYAENTINKDQWQVILQYITDNENIEEVIFSGGDPLATPDKRLKNFISDLSEIKHIQRLRIHTRLPIVIPDRITDSLCKIIKDTRLQTILVVHANHANEFDKHVTHAISKLKQANVTVLNQAVLLKGVNDSVSAQKALHTSSFNAGALPYYLFVLDPVKGAAHFDITDNEAQTLMRKVQAELSGYLLPKLAREIPNKPSKTLLPI